MSAETLRRAAALMREDYPLSLSHDSRTCSSPMCRRRMFHHAVADWLDWTADLNGWDHHPALAVARTFLGEDA